MGWAAAGVLLRTMAEAGPMSLMFGFSLVGLGFGAVALALNSAEYADDYGVACWWFRPVGFLLFAFWFFALGFNLLA
jgi:hypothetical protein